MMPEFLTDREFGETLALGHEQNGVEFKGPGRIDDAPLIYRVIRAMLGMSNRRDGGRVVVGVEDDGTTITAVGLDDDAAASWSHDDLASKAGAYADPSVSFSLQKLTHSGSTFVVVHVDEFPDVPIVCSRSFQYGPAGQKQDLVLRDGALYLRPRGKHETREAMSYAELREVIQLATDKGVTEFLRRADRAGMPTVGSTAPTVSDSDRFRTQKGSIR